MQNERRKGVILSYISIVASILLSMVYTPFVLDKLGKAEFGLYSLVNTIMSYLTILDFGLGNTIVRYTSKYRALGDKNKEGSLYGMVTVLYSVIGIIAFAAGSVIAANAGTIFSNTLLPGQEGRISIMIMIASFNIALAFPMGIFSSLITGYEKYFFVNLIGLIQKILTPLSMIGILFAGLGSIGLLCATTVITLIFNIIRMSFAFGNLKIRLIFKDFDTGLFKEIFAFSFFVFLSIIVDKLFWSTDEILLGIFGKDMGDVSTYSLASTFISAFISTTSVIGHMYLPHFTKMAVSNASEERVSNEFIRISRLQFYVCMLIYTGFLLVGRRFIVELYAGPEYLDTYYIAVIIMSSLVTGITQNVGISVLQAQNKHKFRALIQFIIAIMNFVLSIFAIKQYGAIGAAVMTFVSHFFGIFVAMSIYYQKSVHLNVLGLWKQLLSIGIKYAILLAAYFALDKFVLCNLEIWPYLLITGGSYVVLYLTITYLFCMNNSEKNTVTSIVKKLLLRKKQQR